MGRGPGPGEGRREAARRSEAIRRNPQRPVPQRVCVHPVRPRSEVGRGPTARLGHVRPVALHAEWLRPRAVPPRGRGRHAPARRAEAVSGVGLRIPGGQASQGLWRLPQGGGASTLPRSGLRPSNSSSSTRESRTVGSSSTPRRSGFVQPRWGPSLGPAHAAGPSTSIAPWAGV